MMDQDTITWTGARTPGVCGSTSWRCAVEPIRPDSERLQRCGHEAREGRMQTKRWPADAGSRLKLDAALGRPRLKGQPSSRTGENSPYGMIGGIEETSASFEARPAPRSYPAPFAALHESASWYGAGKPDTSFCVGFVLRRVS